jgi:hypothetical protein
MKPPKTNADLLFESYPTQERVSFQFEPYAKTRQGNRIPTICLRSLGRRSWLKSKKSGRAPCDNLPPGAGTVSIQKFYDVLRRRVDSAAAQLEPYKDEVDHCLVIFGKAGGYGIGMDDLCYALYGDPVFQFPINIKIGAAAGEARLGLTAKALFERTSLVRERLG